jgi:hypothetical protein
MPPQPSPTANRDIIILIGMFIGIVSIFIICYHLSALKRSFPEPPTEDFDTVTARKYLDSIAKPQKLAIWLLEHGNDVGSNDSENRGEGDMAKVLASKPSDYGTFDPYVW